MLKTIGIVLFCFSFSSRVKAQALPTVTVQPDVAYVKKTLRQKKFSPAFTNAVLKNYDADSFATILKFNMLSFLNPPQHSVLVTDDGVTKSREFIEKNKRIFARVQKRDHVNPSVIAALLWVETKHGKQTGRYHVTSVFAHLIQVNRKDVVDQLTALAMNAEKDKPEPRKGLQKLMHARTKKKAAWALGELRALDRLYKKDKTMVTELQGSFAGAFGIAQFIPSSYFTYARPLVDGDVADLYTPEDAISSVSNYLKKAGWNSKIRQKQMKALMHYNNSEDYAESILELSQQIGAPNLKP